MIFPSKILFYLKYQKPVISSMLPGMSTDYKNVLIEPMDDSVVAWKNQIEIVSKYKSRDMLEIKQKTSILLAMKTWQNQGNNVINFIKKIKEDSSKKNI
jgi:hypothetical protein